MAARKVRQDLARRVYLKSHDMTLSALARRGIAEDDLALILS